MIHRRFAAALAAAAICTSGAASAVAVIDQENLPSGLSVGLLPSSPLDTTMRIVQQTVVAGLSGTLESVDIWAFAMRASVVPGSFRFFVNRGAGWQSDADDFSLLVSQGGDSEISIDMSAAALTFTAGESFVLGVQGLGSAGNGCCGVRGSINNAYGTSSDLFINGTPSSRDDLDLAFRTHVNVTAVPEPASYALMLGGLGVISALSRRRLHRRPT